MSTAWPIALIVMTVVGCLVWFARSQRRSAILAFREEEIRQIAKIHEEGRTIDEQTESRLAEISDSAVDPRAMWLRDQKQLPHVSSAPTSGDTDHNPG